VTLAVAYSPPPAVLFDTPLGALGVAAAAASVPVAIHLLNRNRYRTVPWAAMRFLHGARRRQNRRIRLEQYVLLAVRAAIVLLLVAAMAGVMPWAEQVWARLFPRPTNAAASAVWRTHKVLVLDGSLSMAVRVGSASCFERARAAALRLVESSPAGDGFSVLLMAAPPRRVVAEPSDVGFKVADEIRALRLPHGNTDRAATLTAVEDMLRRSPDKFTQREVYFFTDLQRTTWASRPAVDANAVLQKIQARARTVFVDVGQDGIGNLAVTHLTLGVPLAMTGTSTPVVATVHNYGSEPARQNRVELWVGKARSTAADPPMELRAQLQKTVDVLPGESVAVTFPYAFGAPGEYALQVRIEGDALDLDDRRCAVVSVRDTVPVLLVNGKPAAAPHDRAAGWLNDALNPFGTGRAPRTFPIRPKIVSEGQFADAGLADLSHFACVFLCDVPRLSVAEVRRLDAHLNRGGGVVVCLGPQADLEGYNRLLYRGGEGWLPAHLVERQEAPPGRAFSFQAEEAEYRLPPLEAFAADEHRHSLGAARVRQYVRVEVPPRGRTRRILSFVPNPVVGSPASPPPGGAASAFMPSGDPAVLSRSWQRGQAVLVTTTVNTDWTTWPASPSFLPFMHELLRFAVSGRLREQSATVGDVLEEALPVGSAGIDVAVITPDGRREETRTQDRDDDAVLRWTDTDASGVYRAIIGKDPREYLFAVNVPAASESQQDSESDLARAGAAELHAAFPGWDFEVVTDPAAARPSVAAGSAGAAADAPAAQLGPGVARRLLLAAFTLLVLEVVLAWRTGLGRAALPGESPPPSGRRVAIPLGLGGGLPLLLGAGALLYAALAGEFLGFLPDGLRRAVEAGLDIPPPTADEGMRWRLEYSPYLWDGATDPWLAAALALAVAGVVGILYWNEGRRISVGYRLLFAGLRVGLVLLMLGVLLPQLRLVFERRSLPEIAIVLDDSRSMGHCDDYQDPRVADAAAQLARQSGLDRPSRLQLAQALLTGEQPDWITTLVGRLRFKLRIYHCSDRAAPLGDLAGETESEPYRETIRALRERRPEGEGSRLGGAVRQVLDDFRGAPLAAIVMLTDGVTTEGDDLVKAGTHAARAGVPLFFVGLGESTEPRDLRLHDLQVEDSVYVRDRLIFEVRLSGPGFAGLAVPVTLKEKGRDQVLDTQTIRVEPGGRPARVRLTHRPDEPGEKVFVIEVPEQADQVKPATNHRLERQVLVREDRLIQVLYVEGTARYDYRFLKTLLERERSPDRTSKSIDLKVLLLDADRDYARVDNSAVAELPGKAELGKFDVVIFGDVDPADPRFSGRLSDVADFVREDGGGFLMLAGPSFSPHAYRETPIHDILPVAVTGPQPADYDRTEGFRPALTPVGRLHPVFRFSTQESESDAVWSRLEELYWWSECYRAKPAAEVLAVHPRRGHSGVDGADARHPLVLHQFVGAGRSMFVGLDETWRWRRGDKDDVYHQFWVQSVRHLARNRTGRVSLRLDRQTPYRRGEPIRITVRFPEDVPPPDPGTEVKVLAECWAPGATAPEGETVGLAKVEGSRAAYAGVLARTPEGDYSFRLAEPLVSPPQPHAACKVVEPPGELERLQMNRLDMERAAGETGGRFYTLADAASLPGDLPAGLSVEVGAARPAWLLWNHPACFALVMVLLGGEWFLRRRKHLV
jgi:hypothetical protein